MQFTPRAAGRLARDFLDAFAKEAPVTPERTGRVRQIDQGG
jgi:hypothetical protein